jgi:nitrogenase molybdenum-iron protein alpha chain
VKREQSMPFNLDTPVVESREQRLGTIIAWDGKASDLPLELSWVILDSVLDS